MLQRCYSKKYQEKEPTYVGCTVCDEWLNFQNFAKWYDENYYEVEGEKMQLDKDILTKGNKIYNPENCIFVSQRINSLFIKCNHLRGVLPIGVSYEAESNKYRALCNNGYKKSIHLGRFTILEEAFKAYKEYKENLIKQIANTYKNKIPKRLYDAMYRYEVEITD
jgi:hypothetical protein